MCICVVFGVIIMMFDLRFLMKLVMFFLVLEFIDIMIIIDVILMMMLRVVRMLCIMFVCKVKKVVENVLLICMVMGFFVF